MVSLPPRSRSAVDGGAMVTDPADVRHVSGGALRLCLDGDPARGLATYARCQLLNAIDEVNFGLHAAMIEGGGDIATAMELRSMALAWGADLAWRSRRPGAEPDVRVREYETLFAAGHLNATMIGGYLDALTRVADHHIVARFFDPANLLRRHTIGNAAAIADLLLRLEPELEYGTHQISHDMRHLSDIAAHPDPLLRGLLAECREVISDYCRAWAATDHPLASFADQPFTLSAWGMLARAKGHNTRHRHPVGWATAVFYPRGLPAGSCGGELKIGGWTDPAPPGWPEITIRPEPGLLVIMPSWYVHWTEPTGVDDPRLAIAIDVLFDNAR